jgi:hypothetical protein
LNPPGSYAERAQDTYQQGWLPIPAKGKSPVPSGATGRAGTVTEEKIISWVHDPFWMNENIAVRSDGSWIGIDVDAYGDKVGDQTLAALEAELGELPVTISTTSRGADSPSRIYYYSVPVGRSFVTKFADVEIIQHSHRYAMFVGSIHPETGQRYEAYDFDGTLLEDIPSIGDMEVLPESWLERLTIPDVEIDAASAYSGSVAEWLARVPHGSPSIFLAARISEIPQRDFGHDELIVLQASMVALGAQGETGAAEAIATLKKEWLRGDYNTPEYEKAFNDALASAIAKFGALPDGPEDIDDNEAAGIYASLGNDSIFHAWTELPAIVTEESLRERVAFAMSQAFAAGASTLQAATLGWTSAAARHPELGMRRSDIQDLWDLAIKVAASPVTMERAFSAEVATVEPDMGGDVRVPLLEYSERGRVADLDWWGEEFMRVMAEVNPVMSEPYYRLNRWMILSLCFAHKAVIALDNVTIPLNFYGALLGPSNSGKSESVDPIREIGALFWVGGENPDIGGDATAAALTQALIRRDGLPSFFNSDEADSVLRNWSNQQGEFRGMKQRVTEMYMGRVPAIQRSMQKEISGIHAKTFLNVHLTGIDEEIADAIEPRDWRSGFINRFVWAQGSRKPRTRAQKKPRLRRQEGPSSGRAKGAWYAQWVAQFHQISNTVLLAPAGQGQVWMDINDDVLERHTDLIERFDALAQNSPYADRLEPTFGRLEKTVLKCAALVAITKKRKCVEMDDYLIALEQAEEWADNILGMVEATDESPRARQAKRLYELLAANGGRMPLAAIFRHKSYAGDAKYAAGLIDELIAQGRAEKLSLPDQVIIRVRNEGET